MSPAKNAAELLILKSVESGPVSMRDLRVRVLGASESREISSQDLREALWRLIARHKLTLSSDRHISRVPANG